MTLQEAKDQIAKSQGFEDWNTINDVRMESHLWPVVSRVYAGSKWDEGREEQRALFVDYLLIRHHNVLVTNIPRPEFKP